MAKARKLKDVNPDEPYKQLSITGYYTVQELLRAKRDGRRIDDTLIVEIAGNLHEMFGDAVRGLSTDTEARIRVRRDYRRLQSSGWKVRRVNAKVVKTSTPYGLR